jgi:signal transduction histidine kinase
MDENNDYPASSFNNGRKPGHRITKVKDVNDRIKALRLIMDSQELADQYEAKEKCISELIAAKEEIAYRNEEKEKCASELIEANEEIASQSEEKEKLVSKLKLANKEIAYQNEENEKRASELIKELRFQNKEKKKRAAERQFESNNLDALINNTNDWIWSVDNNCNLVTSNQPFNDIIKNALGITLVQGSNMLDVALTGDEYERYGYFYERALKGESFTQIIHNKAPIDSWAEISYCPILQGDKVIGAACHSHDITEKIIAERLLRATNESLQNHIKDLAISNEELEQFAYVASHDLQEPLRMVTSFLIQLEKKYRDVIDDKGKQYIHFAVDGAKRMREIILDLLEFSTVGQTDEEPEKVNSNDLVNEIVRFYRRQMEELGASIIFNDLPSFYMYGTSVKQIFKNLIGNSLKYHRAGVPPVIIIDCKKTKTHFQFSVKDNGIGIDPEFFDKIFIIFQRLHNKDEYCGTGMGLAIVKKIVENLGGKVWLKSKEGEGSTFYFTLQEIDKL